MRVCALFASNAIIIMYMYRFTENIYNKNLAVSIEGILSFYAFVVTFRGTYLYSVILKYKFTDNGPAYALQQGDLYTFQTRIIVLSQTISRHNNYFEILNFLLTLFHANKSLR